MTPPSSRPAPVSLREAFWVWLRIAALSFGGPAGQIAVMHRILVEEKRWIGEHRFLHALNYCMLLPGPEAQQLATYIGWLMHRAKGGIVAGTLFVAPGALSIMALSWIYVLYGRVGIVAALFFGLKCAVLAVVVQAVRRIGARALRDTATQALAAAAFVLIFFFAAPFPLVVLGAGLIGWAAGRRGHPAFRAGGGHAAAKGPLVADADTLLGEELPAHARPTRAQTLRTALVWLALWLLPVAALVVLLGPDDVFSRIALFFSQMAAVTFGGAYAVLAYVAQEAVEGYHWLTPREMLDGLGMAETTPGPLIMVLQFVGFLGAYRQPGMLPPLVAGTLGGLPRDLGHLRPLLPVDLPRRALHRAAARQRRRRRSAVRDHRGGGRRGAQPRHLVHAPYPVPADGAGPRRPARLRPAGAPPASIPGRCSSPPARRSRSSRCARG